MDPGFTPDGIDTMAVTFVLSFLEHNEISNPQELKTEGMRSLKVGKISGR